MKSHVFTDLQRGKLIANIWSPWCLRQKILVSQRHRQGFPFPQIPNLHKGTFSFKHPNWKVDLNFPNIIPKKTHSFKWEELDLSIWKKKQLFCRFWVFKIFRSLLIWKRTKVCFDKNCSTGDTTNDNLEIKSCILSHLRQFSEKQLIFQSRLLGWSLKGRHFVWKEKLCKKVATEFICSEIPRCLDFGLLSLLSLPAVGVVDWWGTEPANTGMSLPSCRPLAHLEINARITVMCWR